MTPIYYRLGGIMMKKIYALIFILCVASILLIQPSLANESELPKNQNYLDLSNFEMIPGYSQMAKTVNPIYVIPHETYTVVLDLGFIGQHEMYLGSVAATIQEVSPASTHVEILLTDYPNNRVYFEFTPVSSYIHFTEFPMIPENYKAIMYQGTYDEFTHYETYAHPSSVTKHYGVVPIDYDDQLSDVAIKNLITAQNPLGNSTPVTIESSNYQPSGNLPGLYTMVLVANYFDTYHRYELDIRVIDVTKPIIQAPANINILISEKKTIDQIKAMMTVSDNVDNLSSSQLVVIEDTYSTSTDIGTYYVTFEISDSSQNKTQLTVPLTVVDSRGPVITGPSDIFIYATDTPLTDQEILAKFTAYDQEEKVSKTVTISSNAYLQKTIPSVYLIKLESVDTKGNKTAFYLDVHVIDNRGPIFQADDLVLSISAANQMTDQQLVDWFNQKSSELGIETSDVHIYYNEYKENVSLGGSYYVYVKFNHEGQEQLTRFLVNVEEENRTQRNILLSIIGSTMVIASAGIYIIKKRKS